MISNLYTQILRSKKLYLSLFLFFGLFQILSAQYTVTNSWVTRGQGYWTLSNGANVTCIDPDLPLPRVGENYSWNGTYYMPSNTRYQRGASDQGGCDNFTYGGHYAMDYGVRCPDESWSSELTVVDGNHPNDRLPSGGSGEITYVWLIREVACGDNYGEWYDGTSIGSEIWGKSFQAQLASIRAGCSEWVYSNTITRLISCPWDITSQPVNQTICEGESGTFCVSTSRTDLSYQWEFSYDGVTSAGNAQENPSNQSCLTTTNDFVYFRVAVGDESSCINYSNWVKNTTIQSCTASINGNNTICDGGSTTLTASGGDNYLWSNGSTSASITVSPSSTETYTVTVTNTDCSNISCTENITVSVKESINLSCAYRLQKQVDWISNDCTPTICADGRLELSVSPDGLASYEWSGPNGFSGSGNNNGDILVSNCLLPEQAGTYTVTVTDADGCTGTTSITINTKDCPCTLNATVANKIYLDNNTTNTAQHEFSYQVTIDGSTANNWLMYDVVNGNLNQVINTGGDGTTLDMGPFPVDQAGSLIVLMDAENTACIQSVGVNMNSCVYTGTCDCCN